MDKKNKTIWLLSLLAVAVVTVIWAVCKISNIELPDTAVRIMGITELIAIPILIYTSIRRKK